MAKEFKKNISISKTSGTASKNSYNYKLNVPREVIDALEVTPEDKSIIISIDDNNVITIKKA